MPTPFQYALVNAGVQLFVCGACLAAEQIVIDGRFDDWREAPILATDPLGDSVAEIDFGEVRAAPDGRFLHLLVDIGNITNIQRLEGRGLLLLDADGNPSTGMGAHGLPGVDFIIELSPPGLTRAGRPDDHGSGIGLRSMTYRHDPDDPASRRLIPYDAGFTFAPTYASRVVEMRLERGSELPNTPPLFTTESFTGKLVYLDSTGEVRDETATFAVTLPPMRDRAAELTRDLHDSDPLQRTTGTDLRVMSWNIERGALLNKSDAFVRVLKALAPDVILFEELLPDQKAEAVKTLLDRELPNTTDDEGGWYVLFGEGGGDLRCGIASRFELQPIAALQLVPYPDNPERTLRIAGAEALIGDRRVLLTSLHMRCCGHAGSSEDQTREVEAAAVREAIHGLLHDNRPTAVIIGGDFNLVGSLRPLLMLVDDVDLDGTDLAVAEPLQLDGRSNGTWFDRDKPFVPGRLDFITYSDATLKLLRSFVLDTTDLSPDVLAKHDLQPGDTEAASDHFPVVVDFRWGRSARRR